MSTQGRKSPGGQCSVAFRKEKAIAIRDTGLITLTGAAMHSLCFFWPPRISHEYLHSTEMLKCVGGSFTQCRTKLSHNFRAFRCFNAENSKKSLIFEKFQTQQILLILELCTPMVVPNIPRKFGPDWLKHLGGDRVPTDCPQEFHSTSHVHIIRVIVFAHLRYQTARLSPRSLKNGLDGTDVRLLKQLAEKFNFDYNIIEPATYYAAIRLVCSSNFC